MSVEKSVLTLAQETRKAIGALAGEMDKQNGAGMFPHSNYKCSIFVFVLRALICPHARA